MHRAAAQGRGFAAGARRTSRRKSRSSTIRQRAECCRACRSRPYYDRTDLIDITTETVRENLLLGIVLVTLILLMFLSNVRTALIVAINIPLALLFAFSMLYLRGKSANLLSIGAVDFGIIVDFGHHGREHLPPYQLGRELATAAEGAHHPRLPRGGQAAVLLDADHGRVPSFRCSPCAGRKGSSSGRWPTPMPSPWAGRCSWP